MKHKTHENRKATITMKQLKKIVSEKADDGYLSFDDLNEDQISELKEKMLCDLYDKDGESPSYGELADADELISDEELRKEYGGTVFSPDDFMCSAFSECSVTEKKHGRRTVKEAVDENAVDDAIMEYGNEYLREQGYEDEYYDMGEIDEILSGKSVTDILLLAYNGGNYGAGGRKDGEFNPNAEYFAFDGYANLLSISEYGLKDYISNHIDRDEFIEWAIEQGYLEDETAEEEDEEL